MDILEYGKEIEYVITDEKPLKIILEKLDEFYKKENFIIRAEDWWNRIINSRLETIR